MFEQWQLDYATRHHIPADWILSNERLGLAAFLEWQVKLHILTITDARRRYVNEYPEANRGDVPMYKYLWIDGVYSYKIDHDYAKGSVLNMIQPFEDSLWGDVII